MAEYIEREALEMTLNHRLSFLMAENSEYDHYTSGYDEAVDTVENFPSAADVAPVVHGRWRGSGHLLECQSCGEIYSRIGGNAGKLWNYCPNCGAKMDGDAE